MEKKKKKVSKIISAILGGLIILTFVIIMILELILPSNNSFVIWAKENVFDINLIPSGFSEHYKVIIHCLILFVLVLSISKLIKVLDFSKKSSCVIELYNSYLELSLNSFFI